MSRRTGEIFIQSETTRLRIRIAALLMLITSFCVLAAIVPRGGIEVFERDIYGAIAPYISPDLTKVMIAVTNMGSATAVISITVLFLALPFTRKNFGLPIATNAILSASLNDVLKNIIARDRPNTIYWLITETGYGFPSGHAMNNAALYTMILLITFRRTTNVKIRLLILALALIMPVCIGISRIYLGVHSAGDVLAGWIMGIFCALLVDTVNRYL